MVTIAHIALRRILVGAAAVLATSALGIYAAPPTPQASAPVSLSAMSSSWNTPDTLHLSFCPLGKAHKHGKGCRGGSIKNLVKPTTKCVEGAAGGAATGAGLATLAGPEAAPTGAWIGAGGGCLLTLTH